MVEHKIATCCYCGARAALTLTGETRHELACSSCGAPLRKLKSLRKETIEAAAPHAPAPKRAPRSRPAGPAAREEPIRPPKPRPPKPRKVKRRRRRGVFERFLREAIDEIEDLFD